VATHRVGAAAPVVSRRTYSYCRDRAGGFDVDIDKRCYDDPQRLKDFLADLEAAGECLPDIAKARLRDCCVVVHAETGRLRNMCYHPRRGGAWLEAHGLDRKLAGCVHLYNLTDYMSACDLWGPGGSLVHELAHAFHDALCGGHANECVWQRYETAVHEEKLYDRCRVKGKQGRPRNLYERVATLFRRGGVRRRHYATTSAAEFFAELSTAFLCDDNKWEPFTRAQLASRDPKTCAFLECVWSEPGGLECCCMGRVCPGLAL